jgi:membrane protein DedA with SNARE-associated domain
VVYEQWPYLGVFLVLIGCGLGLPVPEDLPILMGGILVQQGLANLYLMIAVAWAGALCGDFIMFTIGYHLGHRVVKHRLFHHIVKPDRLLTAERLFQRHGIKLIFFARFLPGLRPMVFMASGVLRVRFLTFALVDGAAACISVPLWIMIGQFFGHSYEQLERDVRTVSHLMLLGAAMVGLVVLLVYVHRRQRRLMASAAVTAKIDAETLAKLPPGGELPPNSGKTDAPRAISPETAASARAPDL